MYLFVVNSHLLSLKVAADADDKLFIAQPCCVQAINSAWFDKLHPNQTRIRDQLALFTGVVTCGLAAPLCVDYLQSDTVRIEREIV
jgi:hypothetical protein